MTKLFAVVNLLKGKKVIPIYTSCNFTKKSDTHLSDLAIDANKEDIHSFFMFDKVNKTAAFQAYKCHLKYIDTKGHFWEVFINDTWH